MWKILQKSNRTSQDECTISNLAIKAKHKLLYEHVDVPSNHLITTTHKAITIFDGIVPYSTSGFFSYSIDVAMFYNVRKDFFAKTIYLMCISFLLSLDAVPYI